MAALVRRVLSSTGGRAVLAVAAAYLLFQAWTMVTGPAKVEQAVFRALEARGEADVVVELRFRPERFHVLVMQDFGRVTGTRDRTLVVRSVSPEDLEELSRKFWVRQVTLLEDSAGGDHRTEVARSAGRLLL